MDVYIDGKHVISGNHYGLTNPSIEVGIIFARVLLEFLGLRVDKKTARLAPISKREVDDIGIEHFSTRHGPLPMVTIAKAMECYPGPSSDAETSLITLIKHADKAVAHITSGPTQDCRTVELLELGGTAVLALMSRYLYDPLGRKAPDIGFR